jgi:hypothetical protein
MDSADLASGNAHLDYTRTPDKDSMREFTTRITNQLAAAARLPQWDSTKQKQLDIAFESRTELEVGRGHHPHSARRGNDKRWVAWIAWLPPPRALPAAGILRA